MANQHEQKQRRMEDIQRRFRAIDKRWGRTAKIRKALRDWRLWALAGICVIIARMVLRGWS